jgi:hypothetical protein
MAETLLAGDAKLTMVGTVKTGAIDRPAVSWWAERAWRLYECAPPLLENLAKRGLSPAAAWTALRIPVSILRGDTRTGPASMAIAGAHPWIGYLPSRFFTAVTSRESVGTVPVWALPGLLKRLGRSVDLTIARVDRLSTRVFFQKNALVVPESVGSWLDVPDDLGALVRANRSVKEDMRIVRRDALTSEVSHDQNDWDVFYHTMYLPLMARRHGQHAVIRNVHQLRRAFRRGGIVWVRRGKECIAGGLFEHRNGVLRWVALGTRGGDVTLMKQGALAALYYFEVKCAHDYGCTAIDFGGTPPILNDGLLLYKKKWGIRLVESRSTPYDFVIRWESPNQHVTDCLARTPLVFRRGGRLAGVTAYLPRPDDGRGVDDQVNDLDRALWIDGLDRLFVMVPQGCASPLGGIMRDGREARSGGGLRTVPCGAERFLETHGSMRRTGPPCAE